MNSCNESAIKTLRYLDNELGGFELKDFLSHLEVCAGCRENLEAEKKLSATLHQSRPLYSAPAALRDRVAEATMQATSSRVQDSTRWHASRILGGQLPGALQSLASWCVPGLVVVAIALCLAIAPNIEHRVQAAGYIQTAVAEHRNYVNGDLQLGLKSNSSEQVVAWFAGKVPFDFRLPAAEPASEKNVVYWLIGASLVSYKGSPAALVTYARWNDKITLLVDSSKSAVVAGGDEIHFGNLTFHYFNNSGFRVITWKNHGLSYALVSSVSGSARASCMVCHQSMADRSNFQAYP